MLYETLDDRRRQWSICDEYAHAFGFEFRMMPSLCLWDAEFFVGPRLALIAEVKHRNCQRLTYGTYLIDKAKVEGALAEALRRGARCGVIVEFADGRFKVPITAAWLAEHARTAVVLRKNRAGESPDAAWEWSNRLWIPLVCKS